MLVMLVLYVLTEVLGVFGAAAMPTQYILSDAFYLATFPAGLLVFAVWLGIGIVTGNATLGDGIPFLTEFILALSVLLNALLLDRLIRRRRRRRQSANSAREVRPHQRRVEPR